MASEEERTVDEALIENSDEKCDSTAVILTKAILGAMLGAIPSMFLWIVLGKVGYLASIAGFFMFLGELVACDFFTKKSKQLNLETAIVICGIVTLIAVYLCEKIVWSWQMMDLFNSEEYYAAFFDYFMNFDKLLDELELNNSFNSSLIKSYLFAIIGAVGSVLKITKN